MSVEVDVSVCCSHDSQIGVDRDVLVDTNGVNVLIKDRVIVVHIRQGHGEVDAGCKDINKSAKHYEFCLYEDI